MKDKEKQVLEHETSNLKDLAILVTGSGATLLGPTVAGYVLSTMIDSQNEILQAGSMFLGFLAGACLNLSFLGYFCKDADVQQAEQYNQSKPIESKQKDKLAFEYIDAKVYYRGYALNEEESYSHVKVIDKDEYFNTGSFEKMLP